ncbi:YhjD/YihY/BrkB family envelope integrity protein [Pseudanabaena sp. FACHB-2040]|uniref:YhjD/YihY/BrkB family envelope integrity protein n=1 Tax=Pseudanabaena sp. FACHB-2040 TaxID=2692859 RepID=UPI001685750A|nr:YihY/virulence factor BrkB family protein [Cyanobacteria bacterium Co-bin8]MBD2257838.1 YihY/virulence factor BrkB family protein [Pseudanabaena sp. FACHB-2040]
MSKARLLSPKQTWRLLKEAFQEWQQDKASRLAAALAYYTVFSLAPLLVLVIAIAGSVFGTDTARDQLVTQIQALVGSSGADVITDALENANEPGANQGAIASAISIAVLMFGASGVFIELQNSLNTIWNIEPKPGQGVGSFVQKRLLSFSMILVIGFLLLVSLVLSTALAAFSGYLSQWIEGVGWILNTVISLGLITFLFAAIFKYLPDAHIVWKDVIIGAFITTLLFTLGKYLLGLYLGNASVGSTYGAAGSLIALLAWIYYSAQILFFGAEFTQVYARRFGSQIVPDKNAVVSSSK